MDRESQNNQIIKRGMTWKELWLYLGYNVDSPRDIERLSKNTDWLNDKREKEEQRKRGRPALVIAIVTTLIGGLGTIITTWLVGHVP